MLCQRIICSIQKNVLCGNRNIQQTTINQINLRYFSQITIRNGNIKAMDLVCMQQQQRHLLANSRQNICGLSNVQPRFVPSYVMMSTSKDDTPLTAGQKLKKAVAEYGSVVIVFHIGISLVSLGLCYMLISSGIDLTSIFSRVGLNLDASPKVTSAGTFVVAYAVHKAFAPVRIGATLTAAPFLVKYLRNIGWLKKVAKKELK